MDRPPSSGVSEPARTASSRPWYLGLALFALWLYGLTTSASGCSNVGYLRGSHELPDTVARMLEESRRAPESDRGEPAAGVRHPLVRASLVREQARLEATAAEHRRAFPIALAQTMLGLLLVFVAMGLLAGRGRLRALALQTLSAHGALVVVTYLTLAPVREAMASAVAEELVPASSGTAAEGTEARSRDAEVAVRRAEMKLADLQVVLAQLGLFGLAGVVLTRASVKDHLASRDADREDDAAHGDGDDA